MNTVTSSARIWKPNTNYHITTRGNRKYNIFKEDRDFYVYLNIMKEAMEHFDNQYEVMCYCLMDNHIHILLKTKERHMKDYIARVNSIYAKFFNDKYDYVGPLYQGRYFSELIKTDSQMIETSRYIHLNPIRAKMVKNPEDYRWSSYSMYIGKKKEKLINSKDILAYFINGKERNQYRDFVKQGIV